MDEIIRVYLSSKNLKAEGLYNIKDNTLKVLKGSMVAKEETNSFRRYYENIARLRDKLINRKIIQNYEFIEDYVFEIPYHASGVILTNGTSGNKNWKTRDGKTIDDLLEYQYRIEDFKKFYKDFKLDIDPKEVDDCITKFNEDFPLENLLDLNLEEYDKKGSKDTLAYAIEHGTNEIFKGFLGNNQNKIIFNTDGNEYDTIKYLKNKYPNNTIEEIFELYKKGLYKLIKEFNTDTYESGDIVGLPSGTNTIRGKVLMLYRPGELLHLSSVTIFRKIFKYFGMEYNSNMDSIMMNIKLKKFMEEQGLGGDLIKLSRAIWIYYLETISEDAEAPDVVTIETKIDTLEDIFIDDDYIDEIVRVLKRKKAIILRGVPGVGKTFSIKSIIQNNFENLSENSIEMIQFHQSYSYEEFVEGLRPQMNGGYDIEKGIFYDICTNARENLENEYFLIIDEINRANLSKVFGELLMLIENDKRDIYTVRLPYSKEEFTVPSNLYIIGTMNTADRSLALVDYALRRRFSFITLKPAFGTKKFNNYLQNKMELDSEQIEKINSRLIKTNNIIRDTLGEEFEIGHSYFIEDSENIQVFNTWYNEIINYEILPLIEEYFFDDLDIVEELKMILGDTI
ncbi:AAA family ATPase [Clostridium sp. Cult1]|uniref:AAA family ATPase n=1 Tax=Clostridium sp. Cult1 TaxID=2079002 RepID=UPI001EFFA97E|nr:AAA family ATPase [Clostridium sp. Cult1]MCF6462926.1 hypothetical protein [Clostridium sp. Cult1]